MIDKVMNHGTPMQLPNDLRSALEAQIANVPFKRLAKATRELSLRYRDLDDGAEESLVRSQLDAIAYLASRLPATFGAISAVLREVQDRRPELTPTKLLDVGAGPGVAGYAGVQAWHDLEEITALERDPHMIRVGKALSETSNSSAIKSAIWRETDVTAAWECVPAELTIAAYVVGELPAHTHSDFLHRLWTCTADVCVLIEPGTPRGFETIRQAAGRLQRSGAHIIAPFPHEWNCLESPNDWCHFSQRVPRAALHRRAKEAELSYEDEKYCYVVASRIPGLPIAARVIRHPQIRSGHVRLVLCARDGVKHVVISRSNKAYRQAKKLTWGSAILPEEASLYGSLSLPLPSSR